MDAPGAGHRDEAAGATRRRLAWGIACAVWLVVGPARGQQPIGPEDDPALADSSIAEREAELALRRASPSTIMPTAEAVVRSPIAGQLGPGDITAGIGAEDLGVPVGSLYAEGTFLVRRRGTMLQAPSGEWIFVFAPTLVGELDTPMVMAPSAELEQVLPTISADATPRALVVTGQVLVYAGRNYLVAGSIADAPGVVVDAASGNDGATTGEAAGGESAAPAPTAEDLARNPDVASLLADLEARRNVARGLAPRAGESAASRESLLTPTSIDTIPEGTMLVRRRARMVREASGAWTLALDNDQGTGTASLVVLPCQNLAAMERLAAGQAEEAAFEVTARVLTFQGRNYAMPLMFSLLRGGDVRALQ